MNFIHQDQVKRLTDWASKRYVGYYRVRSDGDGDFVAACALEASENVDQTESHVVRKAIESAIDMMDEAIDHTDFFMVFSDEVDFPDTWDNSKEVK